MMNEKKLADVLEITSSRRIFACDYCEYGIPFFRGKEITEKYLGNDKISTELFISRKKFNDIKIKFGVPCDGDILLTSVGTLGSVYQVKKGDEFYFKDGNITWFKNFSDDINSKFVYYWLISRDTQNKLNKIAIGTTQKALTIVNLRNIIIKYPSLYEQNFIVHILETLDDKIKLNRRQNTPLEAMAQAIFKEWFVDFGPVRAKMEGRQPEGISREIADLFPDRLDDEGKPEGWERKKLGDLITFYSERIKSDKLTESNYVSTENMLSDKKGITKASSLPTTDSVPAFCTGHILVSNIRPYFKKIWFATFDGGRSNDVLDFCPSIVGTNYFIFNILICDAFFNFMMQTAKGSKMPRGDKNAIMAYPVVAPTEVLQRAYSSLVEVYYKKINSNVLKNEVLTSLRDTLLPKLISGELRVPDAEKMVADIV